ncbi:MAG: hypothetical protein ABID04_01170 [Patescibacteria group bacterium]
MIQLSNRQIQILKNICEEFIATAKPVGSLVLDQKYHLGVSSATIRNEMSQLTQLGYLRKSHSSAGRCPTSTGLKFYVKNLMTPRKLSVAEEVGVREKVWDHRDNFEKMTEEATKELSRRTKSLAVLATDKGIFYSSGLANLLEYDEFFDIDVTRAMLTLVDHVDFWLGVMEKAFDISDQEPFHLLVGEELEKEFLRPCGFIYQSYQAGPNRGIVGVVGPARLKYTEIVPLVDYMANLISEFGKI